MRARRLIALVLLVAMLSGCGWMDGSYVSVTPHQVGVGQGSQSSVRSLRNYTELRGALVGLIDRGATEGLFSLAEYPKEDVVKDMDRAIAYATGSYSLGAYAVDAIDYDFGTGLGASALSVDISYRRTREQIESIRSVRGIAGAREEVEAALDECLDTLVLQESAYKEADFGAMVRDYAIRNPDRVMELPSINVRIYPDRGNIRVVELSFRYKTDRQTLRNMREQVEPVFSSAVLYVTGQGSDWTKFSQLHTFLMERFDYQIGSSVTPAYSLLCEGIGDSRAFAQVYAVMCSRIGLEAQVISGTKDGEVWYWDLIKIDGAWYHVDLLGTKWFEPMIDERMTGYEWDREAYPVANGVPE